MLLPFSESLVATGRFDVLRDTGGLAVFAWVRQRFRADGQSGFYCSIFRNESRRRSSEIILEAETFALKRWGEGRAFTFIRPSEIESVNPGYCFKCAGWRFVGVTAKGYHILEKQLRFA